jgi:hypothetical protein
VSVFVDSFHFFSSKLLQAILIKGILRPSHVCFICGTLPTGTLIVCIPNLFRQKKITTQGSSDSMTITTTFVTVLRRFEYLAEKVMYSDHYKHYSEIYEQIICCNSTTIQVVPKMAHSLLTILSRMFKCKKL